MSYLLVNRAGVSSADVAKLIAAARRLGVDVYAITGFPEVALEDEDHRQRPDAGDGGAQILVRRSVTDSEVLPAVRLAEGLASCLGVEAIFKSFRGEAAFGRGYWGIHQVLKDLLQAMSGSQFSSDSPWRTYLEAHIEDSALGNDAKRRLQKCGIEWLFQLTFMSEEELLEIDSLEVDDVEQIKAVLERHNLYLRKSMVTV